LINKKALFYHYLSKFGKQKINNYFCILQFCNKTKQIFTTMALANVGLLSPEDKVKLRAKIQQSMDIANFNIISANIRKDRALQTATNIDTAIATKEALVTAYTTAEASQPVGSALQLDFAEKIVVANEDLAKLNRQKAKFGTIVVVEAESNVEVLQTRVGVLSGHLAELS
jgi:hypothetical protein